MMRLRHSARTGTSRSALAVGLLTLTVAVTCALSWEAIASARRARATAEGVLRDYATVTAVQFVREAEHRLDAKLASGLDGARHALPGYGPPGHPERRLRTKSPEPCQCPAPPSSTLFAVTRTNVTTIQGPALSSQLVDEIRVELDATPAVRRTRGARLRSDAPDRLVVTHLEGSLDDPVVIGFVVPASFVRDTFERVMNEAALLPGTLAGADANRQAIGLEVRDAFGNTIYTTGRWPTPYTGGATISSRLGGFQVQAGIPPDLAPALVIGGLPAERWPLAAGLLALAIGLVIAAAFQLRREIRFARARADFVSSVSHELRTPLAQIRLFGETLQLGRVRSREEEQRAAEVIVQETRRLSQMVDNILLFSRTTRGALSVERETVDPAAVLDDIVNSYKPYAATKAMSIRLTTPGRISARSVDPRVLRQIVLNLLDNAVKYGPRGQTIGVELRALDDRHIEIAVSDEGPGVKAGDRHRVWEPFWRASGSPEGGTGLGLAIVRDLVTSHGGAATVDAAPGGGARFVVSVEAPESRAVDRALQPVAPKPPISRDQLA